MPGEAGFPSLVSRTMLAGRAYQERQILAVDDDRELRFGHEEPYKRYGADCESSLSCSARAQSLALFA
jgi:hypothetical protein